MPALIFRGTVMIGVFVAFGVCSSLAARAAMNPSFELDSQALERAGVPHQSSFKPKKRPAKAHAARLARATKVHDQSRTEHVIKSGDNLFKILIRDYGLSSLEAEACIDEIRRENNIGDIRRLKVGQKITILLGPKAGHGYLKSDPQLEKAAKLLSGNNLSTQAPVQTLRLEPPADSLSDREAATKISELWKALLPHVADPRKPLVFESSAYSLALDPLRYPVYSAMGGAKIVIDQNASIPALVKSLIMERDPSIRIVSESPANGRRFLSAMLNAAGFYSVEENFAVEFGVDPLLRVQSDFKVEKTAESLIKQDLALVNSGKDALPQSLTAFLKKEGFSTFEPFASPKTVVRGVPLSPVFQIAARNRIEMVDSILTALAVDYRSDQPLNVFAEDNNGISLTVKAQRYFERNGQRCVVTGFDGDPVTYTLFRILETKGFKVVILDAQDDFRRVSEKVLTALRMPAQYTQHTMWPENGSNYSLHISGFRLAGANVPGGSLFLTNLQLDRIVRDLLRENGFDVQEK